MNAPTQYNGKPIPPGTWLAHAAEVAGEQSKSVTTPTPSTDEQIIASLRDLTPGFGTEEEAADRIESLAAELVAVTAERDQARQQLADAPHADSCSLENIFSRLPPVCDCWKAEGQDGHGE